MFSTIGCILKDLETKVLGTNLMSPSRKPKLERKLVFSIQEKDNIPIFYEAKS